MRKVLLFAYACLAAVALAREQATIVAPGNPHIKRGPEATCSCPAQTVLPGQVISTPMAVQPHTIRKIETKRFLDTEVPIYHFQQPADLSHLELPFKIALLHTVSEVGLEFVDVPMDKATNSWFTGYHWSIIVCRQCEGEGLHIGWKFTANEGAHEFYALIVDYKEEETEGVLSNIERMWVAGRTLAAIGLGAHTFAHTEL